MSVAPLAGVERRGRGTLGSGGLAVGIPDSLPSGSHLIQGSHPFSGLLSQLDQGQSSGGRGSGFTGQGCNRDRSPSLSGLLQPVICGNESFGSVEAGYRPFHSELEDSADILQDGDTSTCSSFGSSGRLDGVSGLAGADASGFAQVPQVHGGREGIPIQGSLFWPFHCSTSLHQGHGSCVSYSSQEGGTASPVPR